MPTTSLVLATTNAHKAQELQSMLLDAGLEYHVLTLRDVNFTKSIEETGLSFQENAYIKAMAVHRATGLPVLADDSGLEVDVLGGQPGVHSARYAGTNATDADNRALLRGELLRHGFDSSDARFRCVICVVDQTTTYLTEGTCSGTVIVDERGTKGFGYDAMFIPEDSSYTYGELTPVQKQQTSHRGRAMRQMIARLRGEDHMDVDHDVTIDRQVILDVVCAAVLPSSGNLERALARVPSSHHVMIYEILLQSYLFGGFPTALDALTVCYRILGRPPETAEIGATLSADDVMARGETLCREIYGHVYEKMMDSLAHVSPDLSRWMITEGYGKTLSRSGVDVVTRELCIVAMLTILGRQQQLTSHVRGAIRVGATRADLILVEHTVTEHYGITVSSRLNELILLQEGRFADN